MNRLRVRDLMTTGVFALLPEDPLRDLHRLIHGWRVRHAPVVDEGGRVVGVVSQRDLLAKTAVDRAESGVEEVEADLALVRVKEVMSTHVETARPDEDVAVAARRLFDGKVGCLVVVDHDLRLRGILTESDFVRWFAEEGEATKARLPRWLQRRGDVVPYEEALRP